MRIVKFEDGKFAIRRGYILFEYLDLKSCDYWWSSNFQNNYKGSIEDVLKAKEKFIELKNKSKDRGILI